MVIKHIINRLYLYNHKTVIVSKEHAKQFKNNIDARLYLDKLSKYDRAFIKEDWKII